MDKKTQQDNEQLSKQFKNLQFEYNDLRKVVCKQYQEMEIMLREQQLQKHIHKLQQKKSLNITLCVML